MGRQIVKWASGFALLLVVAVGGGLLYLSNEVNVISEAPLAPVVGLPGDYNPSAPVAPYTGPHPRVAGRPTETFSFPIPMGGTGPVEPLFTGPLQYPFLCGENKHTHRQPLVDNQNGQGVPVFAEENGQINPEKIVGYSLNCSQPTSASYVYNRVGTDEFYPLARADSDIATITVDGQEVPFVVRLETGTINRFHYIIAALRGSSETLAEPNPDYWNQRLIYQFRGGVGIGRRQGDIRPNDVLRHRFDELQRGYAVAYSTGNQTSNHYNMWLAEDTAARVKRQFVGLYGEPLYTVGIGGSGGAIQQYLIAQNHPGLLDAAIPLYSYPDMVTQTINILDCEPLEYYFDVVDRHNPTWDVWENRSWIEGMNADSQAESVFNDVYNLAQLMRGKWPSFERGASECINGWRGLTPLIHNPTFVHFVKGFAPEVAQQVHWTHWEDLKTIYGRNEYGYANPTWDNVGVQYGLQALRDGLIGPQEFLRLNAHLGGWKAPRKLAPEKLWLLAGRIFPVDLSFWSHHNLRHSRDGGETPAARTTGSVAAMEAAYRSGHVFVGHADIPIIDARHYLEEELDMHHATASFSARLRLLDGQGSADNQLIWMADKNHNPLADALAVIDDWMANIRRHPERAPAANRPKTAQDRCFDANGETIARGPNVWDGDWNNRPAGACMEVYPRYKTSREVAGAGVSGDVFKCHLQPVASAIEQGAYGSANMKTWQRELEAIFPQGVCDYSLGDVARPNNLMTKPMQYAQLPAQIESESRAKTAVIPAAREIQSAAGSGDSGSISISALK